MTTQPVDLGIRSCKWLQPNPTVKIRPDARIRRSALLVRPQGHLDSTKTHLDDTGFDDLLRRRRLHEQDDRSTEAHSRIC